MPAPVPQWQAISTVGAPTVATCPMVVWTGTQMLVLGGRPDQSAMGAHAYNPATDSWTTLGSTGAPAGRWHAAPVWDGTQVMISGGGIGPNLYYAESYKYNPTTGAWAATTLRGGFPRWGHTQALYNGQIYSYAGAATVGAGVPVLYQDLYKYTVANAQWAAGLAGPKMRNVHSAFVRGNLIYHFGGVLSTDINSPTLAQYPTDFDILDATNETWTTLATASPLSPRAQMAVAYTGTKALFFGGNMGANIYGDGAIYDPATNTWASMPTLNAPVARRCAGAVWTGTKFIVWGGTGVGGAVQINGSALINIQ